MQSATWAGGVRPATRAEALTVAFLLVALPMWESPANIAAALLLIQFLRGGLAGRGWGRAVPWEWPLWGLIAASIVSAFTTDVMDPLSNLDRATDPAVTFLVPILAGRLFFTRRQVAALAAAALLGTIVAVADALTLFEPDPKGLWPQLRSVFHVNQSALYLAMTWPLAVAVLILPDRLLGWLGAACVAATLLFMAPATSVAAAAGMIAAAGFIAAGVLRVYRSRKVRLAALLAVIAVGVVVSLPQVGGRYLARLEFLLEDGTPLSNRGAIAWTGLQVVGRNPVFGAGVDRFWYATTEERVAAAVAARGGDFAASRGWYFHTNHGHNLFVTYLVERGLVGVALLIAFLVVAGRRFWQLLRAEMRNRPPDRLALALGLAGGGILVALVVSGLANTTLANEHGQAALILLAICHMPARWRMVRDMSQEGRGAFS